MPVKRNFLPVILLSCRLQSLIIQLISQLPARSKKNDEQLNLELKRTKDILASLGKLKKKGQVLIGFALETNNETEFAQEKLKTKNADMIVLNSMKDEGAGPGGDTNKITIFEKSGKEFSFDTKSKTEVAKDIVDTIIKNYYA